MVLLRIDGQGEHAGPERWRGEVLGRRQRCERFPKFKPPINQHSQDRRSAPDAARQELRAGEQEVVRQCRDRDQLHRADGKGGPDAYA